MMKISDETNYALNTAREWLQKRGETWEDTESLNWREEVFEGGLTPSIMLDVLSKNVIEGVRKEQGRDRRMLILSFFGIIANGLYSYYLSGHPLILPAAFFMGWLLQRRFDAS